MAASGDNTGDWAQNQRDHRREIEEIGKSGAPGGELRDPQKALRLRRLEKWLARSAPTLAHYRL